MTIDLHGSIGASSAKSQNPKPQDWKSQPWDKIRQAVRRLQMRIAKAIQERGWIKRRYFSADPTGAFSVRIRDRKGNPRVLRLYRVAQTVIERHIKVRAEANPYDPQYREYFEKRRCFAWRTYSVGKTHAFCTAEE
jgi:hypothetical protein